VTVIVRQEIFSVCNENSTFQLICSSGEGT